MTAAPSMGTGACAVDYVRHGLAVCAIPPGRKGPTSVGWNLCENAITSPTVAATLAGNVGLLHAWSETSVLDVDDWGVALEWLLGRGVNLVQLFSAQDRVEINSGRAGRAKLLFSLPASISPPIQTLQIKGDDGRMILEFRCADSGGNSVQDVLPPSIHPDTGKPYQWAGPGNWRKLPVIPHALLQIWRDELVNRANVSTTTAPLLLPPGFPPQTIAQNPVFEPVKENLWGMTVMETALDHVSPDTDYSTWRNIGWAIMSTGWTCAPQIVHSWSQGAPSRYDRAATDTLIRSFDPARGISVATLFHHAKQNGWTMPQQFPPAAASTVPQPPPLPAVVPYHPVDWTVHGDVRNARHFAAIFSGRMLYIFGQNKWLRWSNDRWVLCDQGQEIEAAKQAAQVMMSDAAASLATDQDRGKWRVREAMTAHHLTRINATLRLAQSEPGMSTSPAELDANSMLLGVGNGVVDLKSGALIPNRPDLLVTRHCAADYDMAATCPRWHQFMLEVFAGDQATVDAVQRLLGYSLTGSNTEEIIIFCIGFGANGKSIFGNIVNRIIGGYGKVAPHSLLAARRRDDHSARGDIAMLEGARLVSVNELPGGMQLDEQAVKSLAGREPISARPLYGEFFTFDPRFSVWVRTNHRPIIKGDDDGIWRRIVVLPFRQKFEGGRRDPALEAKLWVERDGILRWMVEGAGKYLASGSLALSPTILSEQRQYRRDSDLLGEFLTDCTVTDPLGRVFDKELFGKWCSWCDENGHRAGSKTTFTQRLRERGFPIRPSNGRKFYTGLRAGP